MASSSISLPGDVAEPKEKFSIEQLQTVNEEQRISTFNLSDGPLSMCLNVYDGKDLKELVQSLLMVVRSQQGEIERYEDRFSQIFEAIQAQARNMANHEEKFSSLNNHVNNIAQNLQGFVDDTSPEDDMLKTNAVVEKTEVIVPAPIIEDPPNVQVESPAPSPVPEPEPEPAPSSPLPAAAEQILEPSPEPSPPPPSPPPQPRTSNPKIRKRFQRAVKKVILQIKMKNNFVGVLTSRAKKGFSIAERLKTAEDHFYDMEKKFQTMQQIIGSQRDEIASLRAVNEESNNKTNQRFESTTTAINELSDRVDGFSNLADDMKSMEENQSKMLDEVDEKVTAAEEKIQDGVDKLSKKFYDYQDSMAEITMTQGEARCQLVQESVSRCEALAAEILKGQDSGGITSDQIFNLRREIGACDIMANSGRDFLTNMEMCMKVDPSNYSGLREPHSILTNVLRALEDQVTPLWGTVAQFDSNIAQSVNLVVTMQTGLSNQEEALRKMEEDIMSKASSEALAKIESEAALAAEEAAKIGGEMKKVTGEMNDLSSNNADLSAKVYEMMENMDNIVDEEKLKESVKKLLDIYLKQLEAKAAGAKRALRDASQARSVSCVQQADG
mmetsp:Transcript_13073/g.26683  ORF Transcript_13073/g.26683 Transcript_13073/m.26683 type:complete len:612 (+) Transcript_13073:59-1894(+)